MSYGGAPLQESLQMYWEVSREHLLSKVIIAPEFIKFFNAVSSGNGDSYYANFSWTTSQSNIAFEIYNNKLDYFIDKYTLKSTWTYLMSSFSDANVKSVPSSTKDTFWRSQMDYAKNIYDNNIVYPEKIAEVIAQFKAIMQDAVQNNTEIIIVIPIQHIDLLRMEYQLRTFNLYKDYIKSLVQIFGKIYYFAYTPGYSEQYSLFSDPFHYLSPDIYIENLFSDDIDFILTSSNVEEKLESIKKILYQNE